jgi:hypothetical protein
VLQIANAFQNATAAEGDNCCPAALRLDRRNAKILFSGKDETAGALHEIANHHGRLEA